MSDLLHKEKSKTILKVFYDVYNQLGYGFLDKSTKTQCIWN